MTERNEAGWGTRQTVWLVLLLSVAFAGNFLAPRLFTGFNYLFGSVGVLLVLRLFGVGWALVASLAAALWCRQLFGHFYMLLWLVPEPLFVWLWLRRRPHDTLILADAAYWVAVGIPLLVLVFLPVLGVTPLGTAAAALMYLVIGLTNALLATLLLHQFSLERLVWPGRLPAPVTMKQFIFQVLMLAIIVPAIVLLVMNGRSREAAVRQEMLNSLEIKARQAGYEVRQKVFDGVYPTTLSAAEIAGINHARVAAVLDEVRGDRQLQLHLLANQGEVIASTSQEVARLTRYDPRTSGGEVQQLRGNFYHRMPPNDPPIPLWQRAGKGSYIRIQQIPKSVVYVAAETSFAPFQAQILRGHRNALAALLLYLGAGSLLATLVSRLIAVPIIELSKTTTDLPGRLMTEDLAWPETRISELRLLVENSRQVAHTLSNQFREIAQINADLENRVAERTAELQQTNASLRQEIAERSRAERQRDHLMDELTMQLRFLQTLMDAIPNPVFFKDREGRYQGFNRAYGEALGFKREQVIGKTVDEIFPAQAAVRFREQDELLFAAGGVQQYETDLVYADGSRRTVIVNKATYQSLSGAMSGLIGVFVDITDRTQAEQERLRLVKELEVKNKELESIIYVSSHDLRSPLVNIQGFSRKLGKSCAQVAEALDRVQLPPEQRQELLTALTESMPRCIAFITGSTEKMDSLLAGLLRLSRLGRAAITVENLDMNLVMGKIAASLAYQIETAGATVMINELLPCRGDAVQVSQVFTNLLDNAIKYRSAERPLEVQITSRPCDDGIEYAVCDNGIGIPQAYQDQVWEIFHRLNPRDIPGEGLGLTVSRRILDRLNGSIRLESEEGAGCRFFVTLPAYRD